MNQITCPQCGTVINLDESDYEGIFRQVLDDQLAHEVEERAASLRREHEQDLELARSHAKAELERVMAAQKAELHEALSRSSAEQQAVKARSASEVQEARAASAAALQQAQSAGAAQLAKEQSERTAELMRVRAEADARIAELSRTVRPFVRTGGYRLTVRNMQRRAYGAPGRCGGARSAYEPDYVSQVRDGHQSR